MTKEERKERFAKKPKVILVEDCAYLEGERDKLWEAVREKNSEIAKLTNDRDTVRAKNATLQDCMQKLTDIVKALSMRVGI